MVCNVNLFMFTMEDLFQSSLNSHDTTNVFSPQNISHFLILKKQQKSHLKYKDSFFQFHKPWHKQLECLYYPQQIV